MLSGGRQRSEDGTAPKTCVAEWLFSDENGMMSTNVNSQEIEDLYNGYIQQLVASYEKLKTKFNTYAAKCLSEKQKRECGLTLIAPNLVLPYDKEPNNQQTINNLASPRTKKLAML